MRKIFTMLGSIFAVTTLALTANAATEMNWNEEYTVTKRGQVTYDFIGKGTKALIITSETSSGNDLTMGGQTLLKKGSTTIDVTSAMENGVMVYYTPVLENDVTYTLDFYCNNATASKPFTFKIEEYDDSGSGSGSGSETPTPASPINAGKETTVNCGQLYYYDATANGSIKATISYTPEDLAGQSVVFSNEDHTTPLPNVTTGTDGGYPSYEFAVEDGIKYYFYFPGSTYVMITLTFTESATTDPTPEVKAEEIIPETPFTVSESNPLWVYTPSTAVANFYFACEASYNVFDEDEVVFSKNPEGTDLVMLTAYPTDNLEYVYLGENLEAETPYYIVFKGGDDTTLKMALYTEEYELPEIVSLDQTFTVSSSAQKFQYTNSEEGYYYIESDSNINLLTEGTLQIMYAGSNIFAGYMDVEAVEGENGLVYTGLYLQENDSYAINYSGDKEIQLTIRQGSYGEKYMSDLAEVFDNEFSANDYQSAVMLSWGEAVELVDQDLEEIIIPVYKDIYPVGKLTAEYLQFAGMAGGDEPGVDPMAETGDMGMQLLILTGASELFLEAGTYTIYFPEGIVQNADGEINQQQTIEVTVTAVASPVAISPETGAIFAVGENVEFAITFADDIVIDNEAERVVLVYMTTSEAGEEFEASYSWADTSALVVDGEEMTISLGTELPEGMYSLTVDANVLTVDNAANSEISIIFEVSDKSEGVNSIGAALEGNEAIYNLQGVKVDANKLNKGIYIINGKKVLVK